MEMITFSTRFPWALKEKTNILAPIVINNVAPRAECCPAWGAELSWGGTFPPLTMVSSLVLGSYCISFAYYHKLRKIPQVHVGREDKQEGRTRLRLLQQDLCRAQSARLSQVAWGRFRVEHAPGNNEQRRIWGVKQVWLTVDIGDAGKQQGTRSSAWHVVGAQEILEEWMNVQSTQKVKANSQLLVTLAGFCDGFPIGKKPWVNGGGRAVEGGIRFQIGCSRYRGSITACIYWPSTMFQGFCMFISTPCKYSARYMSLFPF